MTRFLVVMAVILTLAATAIIYETGFNPLGLVSDSIASINNSKSGKLCKAVLNAALQSPSSFRRIAEDHDRSNTTVTYDAANGFGTPIRGVIECRAGGGGNAFVTMHGPGGRFDDVEAVFDENNLGSLLDYETRASLGL